MARCFCLRLLASGMTGRRTRGRRHVGVLRAGDPDLPRSTALYQNLPSRFAVAEGTRALPSRLRSTFAAFASCLSFYLTIACL